MSKLKFLGFKKSFKDKKGIKVENDKMEPVFKPGSDETCSNPKENPGSSTNDTFHKHSSSDVSHIAINSSDSAKQTGIEPTSCAVNSVKTFTAGDNIKNLNVKLISEPKKGKAINITSFTTKDQRIRNLEKDIRIKNEENAYLKVEVEALKKQVEELTSSISNKREHEALKLTQRRLPDLIGELNPQELESAESCLIRHNKIPDVRQFLVNAISTNDFLKTMDRSQKKDFVDCMYMKRVSMNDNLFTEDTEGNEIYIIESGKFEVKQNGFLLGILLSGNITGEPSILYKCKQKTTVSAVSDDCVVWCLDRATFKNIQLLSHLRLKNEYIQLLRNVPILAKIPENSIISIINIVQELRFKENQYIFKQGEIGKAFYIVRDGAVNIYRKTKTNDKPTLVKILGRGSFFGQKVLLSDERRTTDAIAGPAGVLCLSIENDDFTQLLESIDIDLTTMTKHPPKKNLVPSTHNKGGLSLASTSYTKTPHEKVEETHSNEHPTKEIDPNNNKIFRISYIPKDNNLQNQNKALLESSTTSGYKAESDRGGDDSRDKSLIGKSRGSNTWVSTVDSYSLNRIGSSPSVSDVVSYQNIRLDDLKTFVVFSNNHKMRLESVYLKQDKNATFLLKQFKKRNVFESGMHEKVLNERKLLLQCDFVFITKLYKTFKDRKYLYMLLEETEYGDLGKLLKKVGRFDDLSGRFYASCLIEALSYLHKMNVVFRSLKITSIYLDRYGYIKLSDFTDSKKLSVNKRTWSFTGQTEYIAPEIILNKGYDMLVDFWSLGILIYELLIGKPPFVGNDPMKTYNLILKGLENIPIPLNVISKNALSLIKKLCKLNPAERLGYQRGWMDVRKTKWFDHYDWVALLKREIQPPHILNPQWVINAYHNLRGYKDDEIPADDNTGWDRDF